MAEALSDKFKLNPESSNALVRACQKGLPPNSELAEGFPVIDENFSQFLEEYPTEARALLTTVLASGFQEMAGADSDKLNAASQRAFSETIDQVKSLGPNIIDWGGI